VYLLFTPKTTHPKQINMERKVPLESPTYQKPYEFIKGATKYHVHIPSLSLSSTNVFCLHTPNEHLITTTTFYSWPLSPIPIYVFFFSISTTNSFLHSPLLKISSFLFFFFSKIKHYYYSMNFPTLI
jgi:hypothetical protein